MNIVFRVDSSAQIGSGHLMRCLTLAGQKKAKHIDAKIYFIARDLEGNISKLIKEQGNVLIELPKMAREDNLAGYEKWLTVKQNIDAEQTIDEIKKLGSVDELIIDSYAIDEQWEKQLRPYVKRLIVIDDLANRKHDCDVLLDQNYYLDMDERYRGLVTDSCKLLLGPKYALLRQEFYEVKKHLRKRDGNIKNIFVFFGGSDMTNETMKALKAIEMLEHPDIEVNVVVGASNRHKDDVEKFCSNRANMHYYCQVGNIAELMNQADLAIGAGGTTTWERCFLELPSIVIAIAENQVKIAEACNERSWIKYIGFYEHINVNLIHDIINAMCKNQKIYRGLLFNLNEWMK